MNSVHLPFILLDAGQLWAINEPQGLPTDGIVMKQYWLPNGPGHCILLILTVIIPLLRYSPGEQDQSDIQVLVVLGWLFFLESRSYTTCNTMYRKGYPCLHFR